MISITLFNRYIDEDREAVYQRTHLYKVNWVSARKNYGTPPAYSTVIEIPAAESLYYLPAREWQKRENKTGYWTLQPEDILIKGIHEIEIMRMTIDLYNIYSLTDLRKNYDMVMITELLFEEKNISSYMYRVGAQ